MTDKPNVAGGAGYSRRAFLSVAAAAGALGAAGLLAKARLDSAGYAESAWSEFSPRVAAVLARLGELWLPAAAEFPAVNSLPVMENLATVWARMPAHLVEQVNLGIEAFEVAALVYGWHGQVFSRLEASDAHAYIQRWSQGATAQCSLIAALRQLVCLAYWREPESWPATGYLGPLHERVSLPALGCAPEPEA